MSSAIQQFKTTLLRLYPQLTEKEWSYLSTHLSLEILAKKEIVIDASDIQRSIAFVVSGLVRGYYINDKGDDITVRFIREEGYITHYSALLQQLPSRYIFQCLEETTILHLPFTAIQVGYQEFKGLERFGRLIAEQVLIAQQQRIESFQFLTAEERYLSFIETSPELFNRISLSHLSTYLGIQRPSLSRIRKNITRRPRM